VDSEDTRASSAQPQRPDAVTRPHAFAYYTLARLGLFALFAAVLYLVGLRGILLIGVALLLSGLASFWLLSPLRDAMSGAVVTRFRRFRSTLEAGARSEDEDDVRGNE
jgi:hypothetical protein